MSLLLRKKHLQLVRKRQVTVPESLAITLVEVVGSPGETTQIRIIANKNCNLRWALTETEELSKNQIDNEELNAAPALSTITLSQNGTSLIVSPSGFSDDDGDTAGTHEIAWFEYDDAGGTNEQSISDPGALDAGDNGRFIGVKVTPIATAGKRSGTPVASNILEISAALPGAPVISVEAVSSTRIDVTLDTPGSNADEYIIERSPNGTDTWTELIDNWDGDSPYQDTELTPETQYFYRAKSVNEFGESSYGSTVDATTPASGTHEIENFQATVLGDEIHTTWDETTPIEITNFQATVVGDEIHTTWDETGFSEMASVNIYRDGVVVDNIALGIEEYNHTGLGDATYSVDARVISDSVQETGLVVDTTAPGLQSATVNEDGDGLTLVFDQNTTVDSLAGITLNGTSAEVQSITSGDGTTTIVLALSPVALDTDTITLDITSGFDDGAPGNQVSETAFAVTNNSTQTGGGTTRRMLINLNRFPGGEETSPNVNGEHVNNTTGQDLFTTGTSVISGSPVDVEGNAVGINLDIVTAFTNQTTSGNVVSNHSYAEIGTGLMTQGIQNHGGTITDTHIVQLRLTGITNSQDYTVRVAGAGGGTNSGLQIRPAGGSFGSILTTNGNETGFLSFVSQNTGDGELMIEIRFQQGTGGYCKTGGIEIEWEE